LLCITQDLTTAGDAAEDGDATLAPPLPDGGRLLLLVDRRDLPASEGCCEMADARRPGLDGAAAAMLPGAAANKFAIQSWGLIVVIGMPFETLANPLLLAVLSLLSPAPRASGDVRLG